jgi:uncharacterized protein
MLCIFTNLAELSYSFYCLKHCEFQIIDAPLTQYVMRIFNAVAYHPDMRNDTNTEAAIHAARELGQSPPIRPRDFRTDKPAVSERHWVRGDAYATALFNAFSAVFPLGETFMARSVKPFQNHLPAALAQEARAFVKQEAAHAREHGRMNEVLTDAGYDIEPLERTIKTFVSFFRGRSEMMCLTATMCIEHFTAIIAAEVLKNDHHLAGADPELHELWVWHAIEETEHKAVAFDVWNHVTRNWGGLRKYAVRSAVLMLVSISFLINRTRGQMQLLQQDGISAGQAFRGLIMYGFGRGGLARNIFRPWLSFFRPGFHPWDHDDRPLMAKGEAMLAAMVSAKAVVDEAGQADRRILPRLANAA